MRFFSLVPILLIAVYGRTLAQPIAPNAESASSLSNSGILLSWADNSTNETGFQIERSLSQSDGFVLVNTTAANITSYISSGLTPGSQYFYRIRATNASGNSAYTPVVSATTGVRRFLIDFGSTTYPTTVAGWNNITAPTTGSVTSLVESSGSASTLSLQIIKDPSNGYGASNTSGYKQALLDYPITATQDSHYGYQSGGTYRLNGLDNGMNYSLRFFGCRTGVTDTRKALFTINGQQQTLETANNTQTIVFNNIVPTSGSITIDFNVAAGSDYTYINILDVVENQATPQSPTSFSAQAISSNQINLTWNDASSNETGFQVERSTTSGTGFSLIATLGANSAGLSDVGLTSITQYFYRVRAINALGSSAYSGEATATTLATPPAPPTELTATVTGQQITLGWTDGSDNETGFQLERSLVSGSGFTLLTTLTVNTVSYVDAGLDGDTQYFYRVRSVNTGGTSSYSNEANAVTMPAPPIAPTSLNAIAASPSQISITWTDASSNETAFEIERTDAASNTFVLISTSQYNSTNFADSDLAENTPYFYRVRAINSAGVSTYSAIAVATTLPFPPTAPDSLSAATTSFNQINLTWSDRSNNEAGFQIERSLISGSGFTLISTTPANATSYADLSLSSQTSYFYRIKAVNAGGSSAYTSEVGATTLAGPPIAPTTLTATAPSTTQINLTWIDVSNNETGFQIERSTTSVNGFVLIATTSSNSASYVDGGLNPGTSYFYRVRAVNEVGNSTYTTEAVASTIPLIQPYGQIYNETSFASSTHFPIVGTAITRSTNKIILTGKPTAFSSYIYHDDPANPFRYTCLEHWKVRVRVKTPTTFNSNSTGITIGVQSVNTYSAYSTLMRWSWVPSANSVYLYNKTSTSNQIISTTKYVPAANTYYWIEVTRAKDSFTYSVYDGSTGTNQLYTVTLTFPTFTAGNQVKAHNTGQFAIHQFGGTNTEITNWEVSTSAIKHADFIGVGDSNMHGMFASSNNQRWVESAMTTANKSFNILAATSERSVEVIKRLPEIIALAPKAVVLSIGRNDLANSIPLATVQNNINTIISTLEGAGITVYLAGVIASNTNVSALQTFYSGKSNIKVNAFAATKSATSNSLAAAYNSGDGIHLNPAGNALLANLLLTILLPQGPVAPTSLAASPVSSSQINLTWTDNSTNETGFQLERSLTTSVGFTAIATLPANTTSFSDTNLNPNTQYFYRLKSSNTVGSSGYTLETSATTPSTSNPGGRRFLIDFGSPTAQTTTTGWNNVTAPTTGSIINLVQSTGAASALRLEIIHDPSNGYGDFTTKGSTVPLLDYPLSAVNDAHYAWQQGGTYRLSGLDDSKIYSIRIFGSRTGVTDSRKASFTINGQQQILETTGNTTETILFTNITASSGAFTIDFNVASGSTYAYINVLDIAESASSSQARIISNQNENSTATKEASNDLRIELYPNPAHTEVTVRFSNAAVHPVLIHLFDMLGKEVNSVEGDTESDAILNLNSLVSGMYLVKVNYKGRVYTKVLLKKD